ncbi:hypothetical protein V6N12_069189 [Hibiscus sabdariffa]|uniref:Uncharacterized protein n=1 Tax=Hibiscus sabdariffa TaxID=183260 RepID=A0ABR2FD64_9ROSI
MCGRLMELGWCDVGFLVEGKWELMGFLRSLVVVAVRVACFSENAGKGHHGGCWERPRVAEVVAVPQETKGQDDGYWALKM